MYLTFSQMKFIIPQLEESEKGFTATFSKDIIRTGQTDILFQLGLRNKALMEFGYKQYNKVLGQFKEELMDIIDQFEKGKIDRATCTTFWKDRTGYFYKELFQAGAAASGNPFYDKLGMTKKDKAFMAGARRYESTFWQGFLNDIEDPTHKERQRFPYIERAGFYADSGKSQFFNGMLAGAGDEVEIYWVLGVPMTCFTNPNLPVITKEGTKKLGEIKQGDLVKTYSGKFRKVNRIAKFCMPLHKEYESDKEEFLIQLTIKKNNGQIVKFECTPNHRLLTNAGWIRADELAEEMEIFEDDEENRIVVCPLCGKKMKQITGGHLKTQHNIKIDEFKNRFSGYLTRNKIACAISSFNMKVNNPMKNAEIVSKVRNALIGHKGHSHSENVKKAIGKSAKLRQIMAREKDPEKYFYQLREISKKGAYHIGELRRNKTYEEFFGKDKAKEICEKISKTVSLRHREGCFKNCNSEAAKGRRANTRAQALMNGSIRDYDNKNRRTGYFYSEKNKKMLWYRSSYELQAYKILESQPEVFGYKIEFLCLSYYYQGTNRKYFPDIFVTYVDGRQEIIEILARWEKATDQRLAKSAAAKKYCFARGIDFSVWDETQLFRES